MTIRLRLLLGLLIIIAVGFFALTRWTLKDIRPQPMKATEESLADMSIIMSSYLETRIHDGKIDTTDLATVLDKAAQRRFSADIYELRKTQIAMRVYVTDSRGIVLFDSDNGRDVGQDYSSWNDVARTLKGEYGARATKTDPDDTYSTILYVAAPIYSGGKIAGVVTVAKPVQSLKLFITRASEDIIIAGIVACLAALLLTYLASTWITRPIRKLADYTAAVRDGHRATLPPLGRSEIGDLGRSFEEMRDALEGKRYAERYVQTLTHELKSPLSSIKGAAELLKEDMPEEDRNRFISNILQESERIRRLVDRMLELASIESRKALPSEAEIDIEDLVGQALDSLSPVISRRGVVIERVLEDSLKVRGDAFLLRRAIVNLLQNAIDFSPEGGTIAIETKLSGGWIQLRVHDSGPGIPDYALERIFDRFYSLSRPDTGSKSTGLGLSIVREIAHLHGGEITLANDPAGGTLATLRLPA